MERNIAKADRKKGKKYSMGGGGLNEKHSDSLNC